MRTRTGVAASSRCAAAAAAIASVARSNATRMRRPRFDLDAAVAAERGTKHAPVLGEDIGVAVAELVQQPGVALDVGEEERDGARWKLRHRPSIAWRPWHFPASNASD